VVTPEAAAQNKFLKSDLFTCFKSSSKNFARIKLIFDPDLEKAQRQTYTHLDLGRPAGTCHQSNLLRLMNDFWQRLSKPVSEGPHERPGEAQRGCRLSFSLACSTQSSPMPGRSGPLDQYNNCWMEACTGHRAVCAQHGGETLLGTREFTEGSTNHTALREA
jgi:hypothetical protein